MQHRWIVSTEESGVKLNYFISTRLNAQYSARQLKKAIEQNRCRVNERTERFASFHLGIGDVVELNLDGFEDKPSVLTVDIQRILYEDSALLVYNKPAGVNCDDAGILSMIRAYSPHAVLIHRLDQGTTGVLLFAKEADAEKKLLLQFKNQLVKKTYAAIVDGRPFKKGGVIENRLGKKLSFQGQTIWGEVPSGLPAYTEWRCLSQGINAAFVVCYPKTGRTHQLRVHLAGLGHPILGDFQYGRNFRSPYRPKRYLLHAYVLAFQHPISGEELVVKAPLPADFEEAMRELKLQVPINL